MATTTVKTRNYKAFYRLLAQMHGETKESVVSNFTNHRTERLSALSDMEFAALCGAMDAKVQQPLPALDLARKRLMAAIGAFLRKNSRPENAKYVKATACQASGYSDFNKIPLDRLNSLYNAFRHRKADLQRVEKLTTDEADNLDDLSARLAEAVNEENYELAEKINQVINRAKNET